MLEQGKALERFTWRQRRSRWTFLRRLTAIWVCMPLIAILPLSAMAASGDAAGEGKHVRKATPEFSVQLTSISERVITISIEAAELADVYAYEAGLQFDAKRFRMTKASSDWLGLSVDIKKAGGKLRFAHTMVGKVSGRDGAATLATLTFERIRGGDAGFMLEEVKLVDSLLNVEVYTEKAAIIARWDRQPKVWTDMSGHWAEASALEAVELGLAEGYPDGSFRPQKKVTRAEFAAMLSRTLLLDAQQKQTGDWKNVAFADAEAIPEWARPHVAALQEFGIVTGYADGTFGPYERISRTEMAVMLARALGASSELEAAGAMPIEDSGVQTVSEAEYRFADWEDVPTWAHQEMKQVIGKHLMRGKAEHRFGPLDDVTRAEAVQAMLNLLG